MSTPLSAASPSSSDSPSGHPGGTNLLDFAASRDRLSADKASLTKPGRDLVAAAGRIAGARLVIQSDWAARGVDRDRPGAPRLAVSQDGGRGPPPGRGHHCGRVPRWTAPGLPKLGDQPFWATGRRYSQRWRVITRRPSAADGYLSAPWAAGAAAGCPAAGGGAPDAAGAS